MARDPAFLFYSSDFLSGISDLTMEERGQYITLLCVQHQKEVLSEKTIRLLVGSVSVDVMNKFTKDENGNFFNERLKFETEKRNKFTESRRNNAMLGGRPKKNKEPKENLVVSHMHTHMEDVNENTNEINNEEVFTPPKFNFKKSWLDLGVKENLVNDWLIVRKNKKLSNTETAFNSIKSHIEKTKLSFEEIITICVENSWGGFKESWLNNLKNNNGNSKGISTKNEDRAETRIGTSWENF